ncbi:MAG: hypothetical protein ABI432_17825 [Flavobacteriales bacterium]
MLTSDLIAHLHEQERLLWRRHGVRLMVDKVTADGQNILCSTCQLRRSLFLPALRDHALISLAHEALRPLYLFGMRPLVTVVMKNAVRPFAALEKADPFHLHSALHAAGIRAVDQHSAPRAVVAS